MHETPPTGAPDTAPASRREEAERLLSEYTAAVGAYIKASAGDEFVAASERKKSLRSALLALVSEPPARSSGSETERFEQAFDELSYKGLRSTINAAVMKRQRVRRFEVIHLAMLCDEFDRMRARSRSSSETGDEDTELLNGLEDLVVDSCGRKFIIGDPSTGNFACIETFGSADFRDLLRAARTSSSAPETPNG